MKWRCHFQTGRCRFVVISCFAFLIFNIIFSPEPCIDSGHHREELSSGGHLSPSSGEFSDGHRGSGGFNLERLSSDNVVYITGIKSSGVNLMRTVLNAHPHLICPNTLSLFDKVYNQHMRSSYPVESKRLALAGYTSEIVDSAFANYLNLLIHFSTSAASTFNTAAAAAANGGAFLSNIDTLDNKQKEQEAIAPDDDNSAATEAPSAVSANKLLCWTDYNVLNNSFVWAKAPNIKVVLVVRDGRAIALEKALEHTWKWKSSSAASALVNKREKILGDVSEWDKEMRVQLRACSFLGKSNCFIVHYEKLVTRPTSTLKALMSFLGLPWKSSLLRHHHLIGSKIKLHKREESVGELIKPLNCERVNVLSGFVRNDELRIVETLRVIGQSEMLEKLGYISDTNNLLLDISTPEKLIQDNLVTIESNGNILYHARYWVTDSRGYLIRPRSYMWRLILSYFVL